MPRARRARVARVAISLSLAPVLLTGCLGPTVSCPAIMYLSTLHVTVASPDATDVRICVGDECEPSAESSDLFVMQPAVRSGSTWSFTGEFPDGFTVRVFAADGEVLADAAVDPDWVRTGGSEACGGPQEASVTIDL